MKLQTVEFHNFKGIRDMKLELNGKSTVIFGINGVGKSSVLAGLCFLFRPWCNRLNQAQGTTFATLADDQVCSGSDSLGLQAKFSLDGKEYLLTRIYEMRKPGRRARSGISSNYGELAEDTRRLVEAENRLPVIVYYGTNRAVLNVPMRIRTKHDFTHYTALERAVDNAIDFKTFFEWFRDQEDAENEYIRDHGDSSYRDRLLDKVREAACAMVDGLTGLRVRRSPVRMVAEKDGAEINLEMLSDGEKCTLALFGDLAKRLVLANPALENPLEGEGIVLIDEIDLHMHPTWQRKVLRVLRETFPNIQFIVTTHSPQVLGELGDDFVIAQLSRGAEGEQHAEIIPNLVGYDSNYILQRFMGTSNVNTGFQEKVDKAYRLIGEHDFDGAQQLISEITALTEDSYATVIQLEGAFKRGKLLYEKHHQN